MAVWDTSFNDLVDFGSPKSAGGQDTAPAAGEASTRTTGHQARPQTPNGGTYGQWLTVPPHNWDVPNSSHHTDPAVPSGKDHSNLTNREYEMQRQINELREIVSSLVNERRHSPPEPQGSRQIRRASDQPNVDITRPSTPVNSNIFASFSFRPSANGDARPPDGHNTPIDPLSVPLDRSDESPMYSRRGSADSTGSVTSRRGQRKPKGYVCNTCGSRFDVPSQLRHHERKHLSKDERPHACAICGDRFLYPKDVTRHKRQVHSITRASQAQTSCPDRHAPTPAQEDQQVLLLQDGRGQRDRRWQHCHASRERRTQYIRELESTVRTLSNDSETLDSRRDSAIADMEADVGDKHGRNDRVPSDREIDLDRHIIDLRQQLTVQHQEMQRLEQSLQPVKEECAALIAERDAFAEIFSRTAVFPDFIEETALYRSSTVERARGWLGAIETLLSSAEPPAEVHESQIAEAMNLIVAALDNVQIQEAAR